jgi:hypothetical protein
VSDQSAGVAQAANIQLNAMLVDKHERPVQRYDADEMPLPTTGVHFTRIDPIIINDKHHRVSAMRQENMDNQLAAQVSCACTR